VHTQITEIYLVGRGTSQIRIEQEIITLHAGDMIIIEPGEAHTFLSNSPDYFHVVLHISHHWLRLRWMTHDRML